MSIELQNVSHIYMRGTPFEKKALINIDFQVNEGDFLSIAGHTGSGKSTLIQVMAGLIKPTEGNVLIDDEKVSRKSRLKIGMVFQYPESQIFEETIENEIAFGPKNLNLSEEEISKRVEDSMQLVGLDFDLKSRSPFELSGGQKRKVAIAGVIAMKPKYLILDEPIAGLDPKSRNEMMNNIKMLHEDKNVTIILISHSMDDVAKFSNRMIVMTRGQILIDDFPRTIFQKEDILKAAGLSKPSATELLVKLKANGLNINTNAITIDEAEEILYQFGKNSS